jgi:hypothetical protein
LSVSICAMTSSAFTASPAWRGRARTQRSAASVGCVRRSASPRARRRHRRCRACVLEDDRDGAFGHGLAHGGHGDVAVAWQARGAARVSKRQKAERKNACVLACRRGARAALPRRASRGWRRTRAAPRSAATCGAPSSAQKAHAVRAPLG